MTIESAKDPKLKGSLNFELWLILIRALLTEKELVDSETGDFTDQWETTNVVKSRRALTLIRLYLDDGPLLNTKHITSPGSIIRTLKTLYEPKGFSADFLICQELFDTTLEKAKSIENYLNRIRRLSDQLQSRDIVLPNKVIAAYTLFNLTLEYKPIKSTISQSYRLDTEEIDLDSLFGQILDESRRLKYAAKPSIASQDVNMTL